jgi:hypothetical protein
MFGCVRSLLLNQIGSLCLTVVLGLAPASAAEVQLTCTFQNAIPPVTDAAAKEWHDSSSLRTSQFILELGRELINAQP